VTTEISPSESGAFPKAGRLRLRTDFKRVYAGESKLYGRFVVLFALPNGQEGFRLGITATRKLGNAVKRNFVKRRLREIYRRLRARERSSSSRGFDLVLNVRPSAAAATFEELRSDVERVWSRLVERSR
jgi:ribonuclease P protein component